MPLHPAKVGSQSNKSKSKRSLKPSGSRRKTEGFRADCKITSDVIETKDGIKSKTIKDGRKSVSARVKHRT